MAVDYTEAKEAINIAINALSRAHRAIDDAEIAESGVEAAGIRSAREVPHGSASAETKATTSPANDGSNVSLDDPARAGERAAGATSATETTPPPATVATVATAKLSDADKSKK